MMRYKSYTYSCRCCWTFGRGHERNQEKREVEKEIEEEMTEFYRTQGNYAPGQS